MKFSLLAALAIAAGLLVSAPNAEAQTGTYTKCKTINGTIIVVKGSSCPAGTIYVGPA